MFWYFFAGKNDKITDITEFIYPLKSKFSFFSIFFDKLQCLLCDLSMHLFFNSCPYNLLSKNVPFPLQNSSSQTIFAHGKNK